MINLSNGELQAHDAFNNYPGGEKIEQAFFESGIGYYIDYVNIPSQRYWDNDKATVVLAIKGENMESQRNAAIALGKIAVDYDVDELDWVIVNGKIVVRMWWD